MAGPFKDDDESGGVSTDKLAKQLEKAVKSEKPELEAAADDDVKEYEVGGGEDDDDETPATGSVERQTRWERKQERKRLRDEAEDLRKEVAKLREDREERTAQAAERTEAMTRAALERIGGAGRQQADPLEQEAATVRSAEESLIAEYNALHTAGKLTPEQQTRLQTRANQIERAKHDVWTRQTLAAAGIQRVDPEQAVRSARAQARTEKYSDVYANAKAVQYADGEFNRLVAMGADYKSDETFDKAMRAARQQFKIGNAARSDEELEVDRRRFSGQSKTAGGGGGKTTKSVQVKKGSAEWGMAQAMFSHMKNLTEEQRVQRWVNRVGSKS